MVLVSPVAPNCSFGHWRLRCADERTDERKEAEKGLHLFVCLFTFFFLFPLGLCREHISYRTFAAFRFACMHLIIVQN